MLKQYLALPGPTTVSPDVLQQMSMEMINHRGPEFAQLYENVVDNCRTLFQTKNDLYILTSSGTGAVEAAIVNTLSPGDSVLAVINGAFSQRFADIAKAYGARVTEYQGPWGEQADLNELEIILKGKIFKAILIVHCETSTAVLNPLQELAAMRDRLQPEALMLVDAVSSLGAAEMPVDKWRLDVVVTGSQKVLAAPPGLAMISFGERAWQAYEQAKMPKVYWDLGRYQQYSQLGQTPFTPALSLFKALEAASGKIVQEGLERSIARHRRITKIIRSGLKEQGLRLLCSDEAAATTVTAALTPESIDINVLIKHLREKHGLVLARGRGRLSESAFRIGHLGLVSEDDASYCLRLLAKGLSELT